MNVNLPKQPFVAEKQGNQATIVIENLYPGYGVTLGNSLRRVLLSSLPGAAITAVKIEGVDHEFSTIPYVIEDVIEIILNLKKQRFRLESEGPVEAYLNVKGEKQVTGQDIKGPSELKVVSQTAPIATLTDNKAQFEARLVVEKGLGYVTAEEHKAKKQFEVGMIVIDSIFSPVLAANYRVENMRVGERTDYNRLIFSIETDGTIEPEQAFRQAIEILISQFSALKEVKPKQEAVERVKQPVAKEQPWPEAEKEPAVKKEAELRKTKLKDLKLSPRTESALSEAGIRTVGGLLQKGEKSLREIKGIGDKAIKEIRRKIGRLGLVLEE